MTFMRAVYDAETKRSRQKAVATVSMENYSVPLDQRAAFRQNEILEADAWLKENADVHWKAHLEAKEERKKARKAKAVNPASVGQLSISDELVREAVDVMLRVKKAVDAGAMVDGWRSHVESVAVSMLTSIAHADREEQSRMIWKNAARPEAEEDVMEIGADTLTDIDRRFRLVYEGVGSSSIGINTVLLRWKKSIADGDISRPETCEEAVASFTAAVADEARQRMAKSTWGRKEFAGVVPEAVWKREDAIDLSLWGEFLGTDDGTDYAALREELRGIWKRRDEYRAALATSAWVPTCGHVGKDYAEWCGKNDIQPT
ncbi:hypothetical protein [Azospirillum brasilense]|uniref:hypothetical protein n=1 Tax=Azospirillum brasilense TaxID=192 RepID=UPI0011C3EA6F|nr:hypothetical protein [Azospirillum brasilense]NUB24731.1 hypothetical protein [Azospirillum brasilense]NUB30665.1 hypothetical protein [Azospirillum brasilense]